MTTTKKPKPVRGPNGGARKGAGRKVANHTLLAEAMRKMMIETLHERFKPMLEAQIDAAIGITTEKHDRKTGELYYVEEGPSTVAAKFVTEQVLGRAKESVELSGEVKGLVGLITQLNNDEREED